MVPLQFAPILNAVEAVVPFVLAVVTFLVVFGAARLALPRIFRRLAEREGWSANGETVLLAGANGAAVTLAAVLALGVVGVGNQLGTALVIGGVVTGVGVERRRRAAASPVTELLALIAGLLAVGIASVGTSSGLVRAVGVFLAGAGFGALSRAGLRAFVSSSGVDEAPADD